MIWFYIKHISFAYSWKLIKVSKSEEKLGKTISIAKYCICYKTYLAFPGQSLKAVSVVRGTFIIHKILSSAIKKHLYDVKSYSFHTAPYAILKNRMYLQKYYPTNRLLEKTIIGLIMMQVLNNLTLMPNI